VNAHQPRADIHSCQLAEQKYFCILNSSIENGLAPIDIGLRFDICDQITSVLNQDKTLSRRRIDLRMAVDCERRRYILQPGHSVRHIQGIHLALSGPIPEREKQFHIRTILKWTAEPEMPPYAPTGAKYSRNDPRILKIVVLSGGEWGE
jgi:hypothetical protein